MSGRAAPRPLAVLLATSPTAHPTLFSLSLSLSLRAATSRPGTDNVSVIVVNLSPRTAHSGAPRASNVEAVPSDALSLAGLSASPTLHANLAGLAPVFVGDEVTTYADNYAARGPFPVAPHPLMLREDSILTADPCSPGRVALRDKLRMRFADAYPPEEGKENVA